MTRTLRIRLVNPYCAYATGPQLGRILFDLTGRRSQWSTNQKAYCVTEATAKDLVAACEQRGWNVEVTGQQAAPPPAPDGPPEPSRWREQPDPGQGLW